MKQFRWTVLFAVVYFIAAIIGLHLATINQSVSPVWPATGIAISILFFKGLNFWPAIAIGAFFANLTTGNPLAPVVMIAVGNTLEAVSGAFVLNLILRRKKSLDPHAKTMAIVAASLVGPLFSATVGTLSLSFFNLSDWDTFSSVWFTWWIGDSLGGLIFIPFIFSIFKNPYTERISQSYKISSIISLIIVGTLLCYLLFIRPNGAPFLFFVFPLLLWSFGQLGERGTSTTILIISVVGILSVQMGHGVFVHGSVNANFLNLQLFLASAGLCSLIISDLKGLSSLKQPAIIFMSTWLIAGLFFFGFYAQTQKESTKSFNAVIESVKPIIDARVNLYFANLQSAKGLFVASEDVTFKEWKAFLHTIHLNQSSPDVKGMGVVFSVPKNNLDQFVNKIRKNEIFDFKYHPLPGGDLIGTEQNIAYISTYVEPLLGNEARVGLDLASESIRKSAADLARDTGEAVISSKIHLIEDEVRRPGFLALNPFYKDGIIPPTIEERQKKLVGWIYIVIYMKDFFDSIFSLETFKDISYAVYEKKNEHTDLLCASPDYFKLNESGIQSRTINIGQRYFIFKFKRSAAFYSSQDNFASMAGATSAILSLFLAAFIISIQSVKRRALDVAFKKTQDLQASEELWKFALKGSGDVVWDYYIPENKVKFTSDFAEALGYDKDEMGDDLRFWEPLIHPEDLIGMKKTLKMHLEKSTNYNDEFRFRSKNGEYKWFQSRGRVVTRDASGKPLRMVGTITDISSRKRAEQEIEAQKEKLNSIFEGSSDALILMSEKGEFLDCNTRALNLFGFKSKEELFLNSPTDLSPPVQPDGMDSLTKSSQEIIKAFEQGANRFEWISKKANGELFPGEILLTAFNYGGEKIVQASIRDLTERKQTEASLKAQREKLVVAAKMSSLGEMAGGIAHEINNPLAIIQGKTMQLKRSLKLQEQIQEKPDGKNVDQLIEDLTIIENTTKRIASIIKGLSSFSRNAENDSMERILVPGLILDTLELSKERFRFHSIKLKYDLRASEDIYVKARAAQLLQVLINLLNNAYDAVEFLPEKWVEIHTEIEDGLCRISITDSGTGIPSELLDKIMTPFFSTKAVGKGTGLGLSISKGIIEDHKGKLYYDSTCKNTRFVIELPVA